MPMKRQQTDAFESTALMKKLQMSDTQKRDNKPFFYVCAAFKTVTFVTQDGNGKMVKKFLDCGEKLK